MTQSVTPNQRAHWRELLYVIIFEADTPAGKAFDVALLIAILASVLAVMLESVAAVDRLYGPGLRVAEWVFTVLFTIEYVVRLVIVPRHLRYARSFFGVVDLLAVLPTYVSLFIPGSQSLLVIRALRLVRIFRVFKLARFLGEQNLLMVALRTSRDKLIVFVGTVLILMLILGSAMYLIEGPERGFTSIPIALYWAIVTMTTVGYGDLAPQTVMGKFLAAVVMLIGYSIIAVPTGIVTSELLEAVRSSSTRTCPECMSEGHEFSAGFCKDCGELLSPTR
jgi:voltage-gated potassium channel